MRLLAKLPRSVSRASSPSQQRPINQSEGKSKQTNEIKTTRATAVERGKRHVC